MNIATTNSLLISELKDGEFKRGNEMWKVIWSTW